MAANSDKRRYVALLRGINLGAHKRVPNGYGRAKLPAKIDRIVGKTSTVRNWRTVETLHQIGAGQVKFRTTVRQSGKTATGIEIPTEVLAALGAGKKPPVRLTVNGYAYRSTVATIDGRPMVGLSAEHRAASGVQGGDDVEVEIELDSAPREVQLPTDFKTALDADPAAKATFERLSNSLKRYHVDQIAGAKSDETRQRRIERSIAALASGKQR